MKRGQLRQQWYLGPFRHLLHDRNLWSIRRRTVVPAFSLGLFIAYLPFAGQMIAAALLALVLRVNIPVAAASTWIVNPLTIGPMYYFAYEVGSVLLRRAPRPFDFELSFTWLIDRLVYVWEPLLLGCVLLGAILSLLGYVVLDVAWRASIALYLARRRARDSSD